MLVFAVQVGLAIVAAYLLARRVLPLRSATGRALAATAGVPLLVIPLSTALGALARFNPQAVIAVLIALLLLLAWSLKTQRSPEAEGADVAEQPMPAQSARWLSQATAGVLVVLAWRFLRQQLLSGWRPIADDLSYHATAAAHWVRAGALVFAPYDYHAYFPANAELFAAWFVLPTRLDACAGLAGLFWGAICALAAAYLCERGQPQRWATLAPALILACEPLLQQAGSFAAVELAGTALVTAAAALVVSDDARRFPVARAGYCGGLCGLAIGCKVSYAPAAAFVGLFLLWSEATRAADGRDRFRKLLRASMVFAISASACGAFWYLRNWSLARNPLFPAAFGVWEGPLDADTQRRTSLAFQLPLLSGEPLWQALNKLLDWPIGLFALSALGYLGTLVRLTTPRGRADARSSAWMLVLAIGLAEALVFAFGPFSGTPDSGGPVLIRSRFFVAFAVQGFCLWAAIAARHSSLHAVSLIVLLLGTGDTVGLWVGALLGVIGCALAGRFRRPVSLRRGVRVGLLAFALVLGLSSVVWALQIRQERTDRGLRRGAGKSFRALAHVKRRAHIGFFTGFTPRRYYPLFGRRWQFAPVAVEADGNAYQPLHLNWRDRATFLAPKPAPAVHEDLLKNLRRQRLPYIAMVGPAADEWAPQAEQLRSADGVSIITENSSLVLFKVEIPRSKRVRSKHHRSK